MVKKYSPAVDRQKPVLRLNIKTDFAEISAGPVVVVPGNVEDRSHLLHVRAEGLEDPVSQSGCELRILQPVVEQISQNMDFDPAPAADLNEGEKILFHLPDMFWAAKVGIGNKEVLLCHTSCGEHPPQSAQLFRVMMNRTSDSNSMLPLLTGSSRSSASASSAILFMVSLAPVIPSRSCTNRTIVSISFEDLRRFRISRLMRSRSVPGAPSSARIRGRVTFLSIISFRLGLPTSLSP